MMYIAFGIAIGLGLYLREENGAERFWTCVICGVLWPATLAFFMDDVCDAVDVILGRK